MGYTSYTPTAASTLRVRNLDRISGAAPSFAYTADVQAGRVEAKVHERLDPRGVTRESRDSDAHPASVPVAVFFDVTGSMGHVPRTFQQRLPGLMALLTNEGYLADPQVLFGAIGDAVSDQGPVQVGQFESSIEMDDDLERIWLEGHGGGTTRESYELAHYFAARHVLSDAWERRQRKGYLFTMGDESFYPTIERSRVAHIFGDRLQEPLSTPAVVAEARQRWHVFHLHVQEGSYRDNAEILADWRGLLGPEHVILLPHAATVAEVIGLTVGLVEGTVTLEGSRAHLAQLGLDAEAIAGIAGALEAVPARAIALRDEATA